VLGCEADTGGPARLLAHPAVHGFAEEVGVTAASGVLLDHVHQHLAQFHPALSGDAEVWLIGEEALCERNLRPPDVPRSAPGRWLGRPPATGRDRPVFRLAGKLATMADTSL
jgi:hypothetical protein